MKKRILSFLLVTAMLIALIPLSASGEVSTAGADAEWLGDYESTSEYEIADVADFLAFTDAIANGKTFAGKVVKFTADVDLGARNVDPSKPGGQTGDGVNEGTAYALKKANAAKTFSGIIDGQGHTLQGVNVSFGTGQHVGIFGGDCVPSAEINTTYNASAGIFNLQIKDSYVRAHNFSGALFGAVIGASASGTDTSLNTHTVKFENLLVDIDYFNNGNAGIGGGLAGLCIGSIPVIVENCVVSSTIKAKDNLQSMGGFFGEVGRSGDNYSIGTVTINQSVFNGAIVVPGLSCQKIGGFVGDVGRASSALTVNNSISNGSINVENNINCGTICGVPITDTSLTINSTLIDVTSPNVTVVTNETYSSPVKNAVEILTSGALSPANLQSTLNENGFADKFTMDETGKVLPLGLLGMKKDAINAAHAPKVSDVGFEAKILGYQITAPADGRFNLQVRGGVKEEGLAEYSAIGLELVAIDRSGKVLTNVKNGSVKEITTVYSSILVNGESTSAEALHTGYVFGTRISNISTNIGNVTILARIYYVQNGAKNYSDIAVITVDTGNVG